MNEDSPAVRLLTTRPDAEIAAELKKELAPILDAAAEILTRARLHGLTLSFSLNPDEYGRYIYAITVAKSF